MNYIIWWLSVNESDLAVLFPGLNIAAAETVEPSAEWPDGFKWVDQTLTPQQFAVVDQAAEDKIAIDIKPAPHPPYSPTQR